MKNRKRMLLAALLFTFSWLLILPILHTPSVHAKDYKKICQALWEFPLGRADLKKHPVILFPKNNQSFTWTDESRVFTSGNKSYDAYYDDHYIYLGHMPVVVCRDPEQKRVAIRFVHSVSHSGKNVPHRVHEMYSFEKTSILEDTISPVAGFIDDIGGEFTITASYVDDKWGHKPSPPVHFSIWSISKFPVLEDQVSIVLPAKGQTYIGTIPVKIKLPETMTKPGKLTLGWSAKGTKDTASIFSRDYQQIKPAPYFETTQDLKELLANVDASFGDILGFTLYVYWDEHGDYDASVNFQAVERLKIPKNLMPDTTELASKLQFTKSSNSANSMQLPLRVVPMAKNFQRTEPVPIRITDTPFSRLPFELRYRAGTTGPYKSIPKPKHNFTRKNGQTILTLYPTNPGQYQVRFRANHKSAWTPWQSFQVTGQAGAAELTKNMKFNPAAARAINPQPEPPGKTARFRINNTISPNSINPQPEPPGKTARLTQLPLRIVPVATKFQLPATVPIRISNTPFSRLPFELRYRTGTTGPYKPISKIKHNFTRKNGQTILTLHPDRPGQYQVRFRANHKAAWTPWQSFQVTAGGAKLARNIKMLKMHPAALNRPIKIPNATKKSIKPQSKPEKRNVRRSHMPVRKVNGQVRTRANTNGLTTKPISIVMPTVISPKKGQKFMLTGKAVHIKAAITHARGQKIRVQVEQRRKGRFVRLKKGITIRPGKDQTSVDILVQATGEYRVRAKNNWPKAPWSHWTNFAVDRLMKNMPRLQPHGMRGQPGMEHGSLLAQPSLTGPR